MILWALEFNVERVIFLRSFSVSVHPDAGRATAKQPRRLQQFSEFKMSTGGEGGGNVYLIKIKTEMKKHKVLFATSHANKGLNRTHHLQFHGVRTKKSLASIPRVSLGSVPVNIPGDWD